MKKGHTALQIAILSVGILILVALTLNLAMGGFWIVHGLDGAEGKSAYEVAVANGFSGSVTEWLASLGGNGGKSAYEIAVENGFVGSEAEWLLSLAFGEDGKDGKNGLNGQDGEDGRNGLNGQDGANGKDGVGIRSVYVNEQGHLIVTLTDGTQVDAGSVWNGSTVQNDYEKARADGYTGTREEWLCDLQTGLLKDEGGAALFVSDCTVNESGHLIVTLSNDRKLDAGEVSSDGYLSETVAEYQMRPRFEILALNCESGALFLRSTPDTDSTTNKLHDYPNGTELLCIGKGEVTPGDEFCKFLLPNGTIGYARSKFFTAKTEQDTDSDAEPNTGETTSDS